MAFLFPDKVWSSLSGKSAYLTDRRLEQFFRGRPSGTEVLGAPLIVFSAVEEEEVDRTNEVTEKAVEEGSPITDHVENQSRDFNISGVIVGDNAAQQKEALERYWKEKTVLRYVGRNRFLRAVITSLATSEDYRVGDGFYFSISLKEIRIAGSKTVAVTENTPEMNARIRTIKNAGRMFFERTDDTPEGNGRFIMLLDKHKAPYRFSFNLRNQGLQFGKHSAALYYNVQNDSFSMDLMWDRARQGGRVGDYVFQGKKLILGKSLIEGFGNLLRDTLRVESFSEDPPTRVGWDELGESVFVIREFRGAV